MEGLEAAVVLIAVFFGILLAAAFTVYCLLHLGAADRARFLPKLAWVVAIVCACPIGGAAYLLCQRQPSGGEERVPG
jgi:hypothetical protein